MAKPKLTKKERAALVVVRDMLDSGLIEHKRDVSTFNDCFSEQVYRAKRFFNMSLAVGDSGCGTVACIGGWTAATMGLEPDEAAAFVMRYSERGKFSELFYPPPAIDYEKITPAQAVKAIDNFLRTGKPRWSSVGAK